MRSEKLDEGEQKLFKIKLFNDEKRVAKATPRSTRSCLG